MKDSYLLPERLYWTGYLALHLRDQQRIPFWPAEKLERIRNARAREIIRFSSRNVPYYRRLFRSKGLRYQDFQNVEDLYRLLPVLDPIQVRKNPDQFRPDRKILDTVSLASSGTTGVPRRVHHDAVSVLGNAANGERFRFIYSAMQQKGRSFREAHIIPPLGAASQDVREFTLRKTMIPRRSRIERRYFSMLDDMEMVIRELNEYKPDVIRAYGSLLSMLVEAVLRSGIKLTLPGVFIYSADAMSPVLKRVIMEDWGVPVFSEYNSVETLQLGFECEEHRGYHLNDDCYPVRIVDENDRELPDGSRGRVIISNLVNRANVLLNYELGDHGVILPGQCGCGRTQKMLSLSISRVAERFTLEDGTEIHPIIFAEAVFHEKDLWQHQVVHSSGNEFEVLLVANPDTDKAAMEERLTAEFVRWFQDRIRFKFRFVDKVEMNGAVKPRAVIFRNPGENS